MERCRTLREYSEFVARIRRYAVGETAIGEAVDRAVTECIEEGILADFLRGQRAEVIAMSIFEYNEEEEMRKLREGEREIWEKRGKAEGKAEALLLILEFRWPVPGWLKERIIQEADALRLESWMKAAMGAGTLENFLETTGLAETWEAGTKAKT